MHNFGSIWLLSSEFIENSVQPLYKFKKPAFENLDIILPIIFDEEKNEFVISFDRADNNLSIQNKDEILINNKKVLANKQKLNNGDIITYKGYKFRVDLYDMEENLAFNSFWHENLYLGNLPVFSSKAFGKLMEVEIQKAKRYKYPFSLILLRFENPINNINKEIEKIICENIRFTDMLSKISDYEYILYLLQVKKDNIPKIIEKLKKLIYELLDIRVEFANGIEFDEKFDSFVQMIIKLYQD